MAAMIRLSFNIEPYFQKYTCLLPKNIIFCFSITDDQNNLLVCVSNENILHVNLLHVVYDGMVSIISS